MTIARKIALVDRCILGCVRSGCKHGSNSYQSVKDCLIHGRIREATTLMHWFGVYWVDQIDGAL